MKIRTSLIRSLLISVLFGVGSYACFGQEPTREGAPVQQPAVATIEALMPSAPGPNGLPPGNSVFSVDTIGPDGNRVMYNVVLPSIPSSEADNLNWLSNQSVAQELEIVEEQRDEMARIHKDFNKKMGDLVAGDLANGKNISERMAKIQDEKAQALTKVLLPHQRKRIKQIGLQIRMRSAGTANSFQSGPLAEELEVTDEQKKKMLELKKEWDKRIKEKVQQMRAEAKKDILGTLNREQREEYDELIGETFERIRPVPVPREPISSSRENQEILELLGR